MDREKVIKGLENCLHYKGHCLDCTYNSPNCQNDVLNDALALLKEQEERWIPVTERLPEDDTDILAYCTDGEESRIDAVNYANGVWYSCIFNAEMAVENITHWMPLPDEPKEGR